MTLVLYEERTDFLQDISLLTIIIILHLSAYFKIELCLSSLLRNCFHI